MASEEFGITPDMQRDLLRIFDWLDNKGHQGGKIEDLNAYETAINHGGPPFASYLLRPETRVFFDYHPANEIYFLNSRGKEYFQTLKQRFNHGANSHIPGEEAPTP